MSLVYWNDPVIWEMLVHDFSHLSVFSLQNLWSEGEKDKDDRSLLCKCDGSMFRIRIGWELIVEVIVFDWVYEMINQYFVNRIPFKILARVVLWDYFYLSLWIINVPSTTDKFADLSDKVWAVLTLVSDVAYYEALSSESRDKAIQKKQHASIEVYALTEQSFRL